MKYHQLVLPRCELYLQEADALFDRVKALSHPDIKRTMRWLAEAACMYAKTEHGLRYIELAERFSLKPHTQAERRSKYGFRGIRIDTRCWRQARSTAANVGLIYQADFSRRELICLSLLTLGELTDKQLTELLLALLNQKAAIVERYA